MTVRPTKEKRMGLYRTGDFVKVVFQDDRNGESERMWVKVATCDDERRVVFGSPDNEPIAVFQDKLWLGKEIAVSYDLVVDVLREGKGPSSQVH